MSARSQKRERENYKQKVKIISVSFLLGLQQIRTTDIFKYVTVEKF